MKLPDLSLERSAWDVGHRWVAGIDEAGRGAWAGPVAAAAVVLPPDCPSLQAELTGVRDSKTLSPRQRERLLPIIQQTALAVGVGLIDPGQIVAAGIAVATRQAMVAAVQALAVRPDFLLVDYLRLPELDIPCQSIVRGDQKSLSIAAASIVAKVTRDRWMTELAARYPGYGFERHKGYGTRAHHEALQRQGCTPLHRHTWAPMVALTAPPTGG